MARDSGSGSGNEEHGKAGPALCGQERTLSAEKYPGVEEQDPAGSAWSHLFAVHCWRIQNSTDAVESLLSTAASFQLVLRVDSFQGCGSSPDS